MAWTERYVRADAAGSGDGTTNTNSGVNGAWTLAEAVTNETAGMRLNVRAGTYASTTTTRTLAAVGTTTAPIWWRGFNTTPGDLDTSHALALPALTFTTGQFVVSGAFHILSSLDVSGACVTANGQFSVTGASCWVHRCRSANAGTNANSRAFTFSSAATDSLASRCWFSATGSATYAAVISGGRSQFVGCVVRGGATGIALAAAPSVAVDCVADDPGSGSGIEVSATGAVIVNCSVYGAGTDAVRITAANLATLVYNLLSSTSGGYSVNQNAGTNSASVRILNNAFYAATSGEMNGVTESLGFSPAALALAADPFAGAASHNFAVASASAAKAAGAPADFTNETYVAYPDCGAVQHADAGASGPTYFAF